MQTVAAAAISATTATTSQHPAASTQQPAINKKDLNTQQNGNQNSELRGHTQDNQCDAQQRQRQQHNGKNRWVAWCTLCAQTGRHDTTHRESRNASAVWVRVCVSVLIQLVASNHLGGEFCLWKNRFCIAATLYNSNNHACVPLSLSRYFSLPLALRLSM